jgi:hypothetical protein
MTHLTIVSLFALRFFALRFLCRRWREANSKERKANGESSVVGGEGPREGQALSLDSFSGLTSGP